MLDCLQRIYPEAIKLVWLLLAHFPSPGYKKKLGRTPFLESSFLPNRFLSPVRGAGRTLPLHISWSEKGRLRELLRDLDLGCLEFGGHRDPDSRLQSQGRETLERQSRQRAASACFLMEKLQEESKCGWVGGVLPGVILKGISPKRTAWKGHVTPIEGWIFRVHDLSRQPEV